MQQQRRERHVLPVLGVVQPRRLAQVQPNARLLMRLIRLSLMSRRHQRVHELPAAVEGAERVGPASEGGHLGGDGGGGGRNRLSRESAGAGGGDDGGLGVAEEPLDGLPVGAVAELPGQLEDPGGAHGRHPDSPSPTVDFGVAVPGRRGLSGLRELVMCLGL